MLEGKKETIIKIDYSSVEKAVVEFLKTKNIDIKEYNIPDSEECSNDSSIDIAVSPSLPDKYCMDRLNDCELEFQLRKILDWMCYEGQMEEGNWIIEVCW